MPGKKKTHFTITEAAKKLGISRVAVHEAISTGRLKAKRGKIRQIIEKRAWLIPLKSLKKYRVSLSHQQRGKKTNLA